MKISTGLICTAIITAAFSATPLSAAPKTTAPGKIDFGEFKAPEGGQFVEVNIQGNLINMVARLSENAEPEVGKILRGLKSIRVNVIGMNEENSGEIIARIKSVREQLDAAGWDRIVTVQDKKEDVGVFVKLKGEEAIEGIAVTILGSDRKAVFVNIVGNIRPEQIAEVAERLNIEPLKKIGRQLGSN